MPDPQPSPEFTDWYGRHDHYFVRASEDALELVQRFVDDWSEEHGFRCERQPSPRIKEPERAYAKCVEKGIVDDFDRLLEAPFAVGDLVGVRFVVRSRADVEAVLIALQNQDALAYRDVEDVWDKPRESGYRAVHVNSSLTVAVRDVAKTIPFEVQVKTLLQDAWGYFTHDTAYVPTEANNHPRYAHIRELQRLLADQLHVVDQLQQQVEVQAEQTVYDLAEIDDESVVMFASVRRAMEDVHGVRVSVSEAHRLAQVARNAGVVDITEFREVVAPDTQQAIEVADSVRANRKRSPSAAELATELLRRRGAQ